MVNQIQGVITDTLVTVLLALITLAATYATFYLQKATKRVKAEIEAIEDAKQKSFLYNALQRLEDVTLKTVNKIEQETAKQLRQAVKDGKIDRSELEELTYDAYKEIIRTMEPDYVKAIQENLGDAQTYIINTIKEKVEILKSYPRPLRE